MSMLTVLIVDDEHLMRDSIRLALEELPFEICLLGEAEDGEDALEQYRRLMPDIIISDIKMPGMSGLDLIGTIRRTDEITQFIIVSGYADFEYAQDALKHGVAQYVLKPVKSAELESALLQCAAHLAKKYTEVLPESDRLIKYIQENYTSPLSLDLLAQKFNFNPQYISQLVKSKVNQNFSDYLITLRMKQATELLSKTDQDIKMIAEAVGYEDQHYFHRVFKKRLNKTPAQYRKDVSPQKGKEL